MDFTSLNLLLLFSVFIFSLFILSSSLLSFSFSFITIFSLFLFLSKSNILRAPFLSFESFSNEVDILFSLFNFDLLSLLKLNKIILFLFLISLSIFDLSILFNLFKFKICFLGRLFLIFFILNLFSKKNFSSLNLDLLLFSFFSLFSFSLLLLLFKTFK